MLRVRLDTCGFTQFCYDADCKAAGFRGSDTIPIPPALCEAVRPKRAPLVGAPSRVEGGGILEVDRADELSEEALMSFPLDEVVAEAQAARKRTYGGAQR